MPDPTSHTNTIVSLHHSYLHEHLVLTKVILCFFTL